jgi:GR25 family glycosyltransferase involved in LPS biosynthesis
MNLDTLPAVCINLRRRQDRWKEFQAQPGLRHFPPVERFEAIDGAQMDVLNDPQLGITARRNIMTGVRRSHHEIVAKNSVAIYHTHVATWRHLLDKTDAPALIIMEDDLRVDPDSYAKLKRLFDHPVIQSGDWDILNPGALVRHRTDIDEELSRYDYSYLFHCYIVSRRGAQRLLERAYPIEVHVDHYSALLAQMGALKVYGPRVRIFYQRSADSDNRDGSCQTCHIPNNANETGKYLWNGRLRMYQLEESVLAIGLVLGVAYFARRWMRK